MNWKATLRRLVTHPEIHGKFLNMLSLLEYIGARKIMKSQHEKSINGEVLSHMVEEIRHAQIFKKLALKVNPRVISYDRDLLVAGEQGKAYMQNVDRGVESLLGMGRPWTNYLLSTLIIEERANSIYPYYAELLHPLGLDGPLRTIVREEQNHLEDIQQRLLETNGLNASQLAALRKVEEQAFNGIIEELDNALDSVGAESISLLQH